MLDIHSTFWPGPMYVCVCNKVTDKQLKSAVENGAHSLGALQKSLAVGTNCGTCLETAQSMLNESLSELLAANPDIYYAA